MLDLETGEAGRGYFGKAELGLIFSLEKDPLSLWTLCGSILAGRLRCH